MSKVLIIGAGGVANVVAKKCAQNSADYSELLIATRTKSRADKIASEITNIPVHTAKVDADHASEVAAIIRDYKPKLVMNIALPYQDLAIMDACLETGVDYLDTANYEPKDVAHFEYSWQWAYQERFQKAGIMALLGSGFDPGQTNVYTAWLKKHHFDRMDTLDIVDCNNGDHGKAFATNFNPEINIREITQNGRYWQDGRWVETAPLEIKADIEYPEVANRGSYVLFHEELESLVKNYPELKRARFWMTFGDNYIKNRPRQVPGRGHHPAGIPEGAASRPRFVGRQLLRPDVHRLPGDRREGRKAEDSFCLQRLRPRQVLSGDRRPGHLVHHRGPGHAGRRAHAARHLEEGRRGEHGRDGSGSFHGGNRPMGIAVDRAGRRRGEARRLTGIVNDKN
jgi:hypothetical protein